MHWSLCIWQFDINKTTRPKAYFGFWLVLACLCTKCRLRSSERRFFEFEKIRISENFGFRARYQSVEFRQTFVKMHVGSNTSAGTGKSLSEALIFASTNPQYDKRLFIDLPVQ